MGWTKTDVIRGGQFIYAEATGGWYIDLFGGINENTVLERLRGGALGWTPTSVVIERGFFGIGDKLLIFGRAAGAGIPSETVRLQAASGLNSFWNAGGADVVVYASDDLNAPVPKQENWTGTIQIAAIAIIAVAVVFGIKQVREITK